MSTWFRVRRHADRAVALVLLVVASPVIFAAGVAVRRHDGGPALIAVDRIGRGGHPFRMWKVRTMRAEAPDGMATGPALTADQDPRVTKVGARLRAYHVDELPQLYNVVRGEMVLLGPRPEAPDFVDLSDPAWVAVLAAPPGIAGPTQVLVGEWERQVITADESGRGYVERVLPVKLAIDAWYVRRCSPSLDASVVAALGRHLRGRAPSTLEARAGAEVPELGGADLRGGGFGRRDGH